MNTATPNLADLADIAQCTYMHGRLTPQSIKHRWLEYHYTKLGRSSTMHKYAWQIYLPSQSSIDALNTATLNLAGLADIAQCTYMHGRSTPQSIEHRCLEYCYTKLGKSSRYSTMHIYTWQIYPPQSIEHRCLEYCYTKLGKSSRYSTMHIYAWQIYPPQSIEHRCLEYCYTKLGRSNTMHKYAWQIYLPSQSSIDALNTTTPNLADLAQCIYMHDKWNPQLMEHRCLEYCYTKLGRSSRYSTMHIYAWQIDSPVNQA